jgi:hypothetical protein
MKEGTYSVPTGTFPASKGETVRVSLKKVNGLTEIDAVVVNVVTGCGVSDRVVLRYDETMLPFGVNTLLACHISGFQKKCACCAAKLCQDIFSPGIEVYEGVAHAFIMPADFRLDQVKFYSPDPKQVPIKLQLLVDSEPVFPMGLEMDEFVLAVNRAAFNGNFDSGFIKQGQKVEVQVLDAPMWVYYYGIPWVGLSVCLNGIWYPHSKTTPGSLHRTKGRRQTGDSSGYPSGWVDMGGPDAGIYVVDENGNFVIE